MIPADKKTERSNPWQEREHASRAWGILLFGLIGSTATAFAVGQLRRTVDWFYTQVNKSQSNSSWRSTTSSSNRGSYREETWNRYNRRMQEEYEEEMERVERIRCMQSVFNRERNKYKRCYESWRENGPGAYQHFQQDDWSREKPYSEAEIKTAFRAKAMEYHPDQNQDNKETAEAKFKEVMTSYEAIKLERKNGKC